PHMDLPVGLGLGIGTLVGLINTVIGTGAIYFDSLAVLVFLLLIGRWIQFRQQNRAAKAVDLMMRITPHHAKRVSEDGTTQLADVRSLVPGQVVRVAAGESVPVDGVIQTGCTSIDRSLLTGESRPEHTRVGHEVCAGTLNIQRTIDVEVTATGRESRIGKVMTLVESAFGKKAPIVQLADRVGGIFVVAVTAVASVTFAVWVSDGWQVAAAHATSLLIVACPCALALATPLAIAVALGRSARNKLFVRDGGLLQQLARAGGTVWFDKTGTLTLGQPRVTKTVSNDASTAVAYAAAVESGCAHPVAVGILEEAKRRSVTIPMIDSPPEMRQGGIQGTVLGHDVLVGNVGLIQDSEAAINEDQLREVDEILGAGQSPIVVAIDRRVEAIFAISDPLRPDAREVVRKIRNAGWEVGILSGDSPQVVSGVARELDIQMAEGGVTPEGKLAAIQSSRKSGRCTVMIGDGANDAAALAAADVGIAVRGGAEVSLRAAPVYIASGRLTSVLDLLSVANSTQRLIQTTFAVSLTYNAIAVALAITGSISPLIAAVLMPISSISVLTITLAWPILGGCRP
ncbi:MAG: heavy metal translocating P-type ATPase, partial [Planctomycetota bacterium]